VMDIEVDSTIEEEVVEEVDSTIEEEMEEEVDSTIEEEMVETEVEEEVEESLSTKETDSHSFIATNQFSLLIICIHLLIEDAD